MNEPKRLRFYLDQGLRESAVNGSHNFINKIASAAISAGYTVEYRPNSVSERIKSATRNGYSMFHMDDPVHARALTMRRVYYYPFWAIENSAARWDWRVAKARFEPKDVCREQATDFYHFWQSRLFGDAAASANKEGFVYVPLQGRLLEKRSFQKCSPLEMIRSVLKYDKNRKVVATLHPKETYSVKEQAALSNLCERFPRFEVKDRNMTECLKSCDYVVTQNSSAGFAGYFFEKPCVLFGKSDFHHIAANATMLGDDNAISQAPELKPDYAGYIHWFWQKMSINAGHPQAKNQILAAFERAGWPT